MREDVDVMNTDPTGPNQELQRQGALEVTVAVLTIDTHVDCEVRSLLAPFASLGWIIPSFYRNVSTDETGVPAVYIYFCERVDRYVPSWTPSTVNMPSLSIVTSCVSISNVTEQ